MRRTHALVSTTLITVLAASGCSLVGTEGAADPVGTTQSGTGTGADSKEVVLVTHDSFVLSDALQREFTQETGYDLVIRSSGDAGTLTNKLVLTQGDPTGDVAFGVDNTFASRAIDADVFASYTPADVPDGVEAYDLPGDTDHDLTPIDNGNVCVNVDDAWFAAHDQTPPRTMEDLTDPAHRDQFVLPGAATSSTGLAFLLATIAEYGDQWPAYWTKLMDNGAELTAGWSDAYEVDFTAGGGQGDRPIVLSYDSSPAFTVDKKTGTSTTSALLDTCFRQIEYAGVLTGAQNPAGAQAFIDFMLTPQVQEALPESMYVFPVVTGTTLPTDWATYAVQPTDPYAVDPTEIADQRDSWLREWSDVTSR